MGESIFDEADVIVSSIGMQTKVMNCNKNKMEGQVAILSASLV